MVLHTGFAAENRFQAVDVHSQDFTQLMTGTQRARSKQGRMRTEEIKFIDVDQAKNQTGTFDEWQREYGP